MKKITRGKAKVREYNEDGKILKEIKVDIRLCTGEDPQVFCIDMPDKSKTRHIEIVFTRKLIETIINTNWQLSK